MQRISLYQKGKWRKGSFLLKTTGRFPVVRRVRPELPLLRPKAFCLPEPCLLPLSSLPHGTKATLADVPTQARCPCRLARVLSECSLLSAQLCSLSHDRS